MGALGEDLLFYLRSYIKQSCFCSIIFEVYSSFGLDQGTKKCHRLAKNFKAVDNMLLWTF